MEILGLLSFFALIIIAAFYYMQYSDKENNIVKEKALFYFRHSRKFETIVRKQKINIEQDINKLKENIKIIDEDLEEQEHIRKSLESLREEKLRTTSDVKKRNYIAFQNIEIIRRLRMLNGLFDKKELVAVIKAEEQIINVESKIMELTQNGIVEFHIDKNRYSLDMFSKEIKHPFELDEKGNPKIVD